MKILDRYVAASFVKNYILSFMILVGLYVTLDMLFNFDDLMTVRTKVARSESTPSMPILAKIAVIAANPADNTAQKNQLPEVVMDRSA